MKNLITERNLNYENQWNIYSAFFLQITYGLLSISPGWAFSDSTNCRLKIFFFNSRKFLKVKFEFAMPSNYLDNIYIVLGICYLPIILSIQEDVHRLTVNTMPIYIRIWELANLGIFRGVPETNPPQKPRSNCIFFFKGTAPNALFWFFLCNYANKYHAEKGLVLMDNQRQCFLPGKKVRKDVGIWAAVIRHCSRRSIWPVSEHNQSQLK